MARGCGGSRMADSMYVCVDSSPFGKPVDWFVVDPAVPLDITGAIRAPLLLPDPDGVYHLVLGVGAVYYPYVSDFIEEVRVMGVSKKIPRGFDYRKLTPGESNLVLVHPKAIPEFSYSIQENEQTCFRHLQGKPEEPHQCLADNYPLSMAQSVDEKHEVEQRSETHYMIHTPSASYVVSRAYEYPYERKYSYGAFMRFPHFHFEYVNNPSKSGDPEYKVGLKKLGELYTDYGYGFRVVEE